MIGRKTKNKKSQFAYKPITKENNMDMNKDGTNNIKEGSNPMSPVSSSTAPLLIRLEHLNIILRAFTPNLLTFTRSIYKW